MLSRKRDKKAANRFFKKALKSRCNQTPRVINVDKNSAYLPVIEDLKENDVLPEKTELKISEQYSRIGSSAYKTDN
jgi:transposase-like protein